MDQLRIPSKDKLIVSKALQKLKLIELGDEIYCKKRRCWGNLFTNQKLIELNLDEGECKFFSVYVIFKGLEKCELFKVKMKICRYKDTWNLPPYRCYFKAKIIKIDEES